MGSLPRALNKITLILEYDGTNYCGFQIQTALPTIQAEVERAIRKLTGEEINIRGASRTDAGVHAKGQVISFITGSKLPPDVIVNALNHYLPDDIAVKAAYRVDEKLDVRHGAVSREYQYSILNSPTRSPLKQRYSHLVNRPLNIDEMNRACQALIGAHDFASFATCIAEGVVTIRRVYRTEVTREDEMVKFNIIANAFLPHQIRNTAGALIKVGLGKMNVNEFYDMMESKQPGLAGPTAPPCGLCLMKINYT